MSRMGVVTKNTHTSQDTVEIKKLKEGLIRRDVLIRFHSLMEVEDTNSPMNQPFSESEYLSSLSFCNIRSSPGLDRISYEVIRKLSQLVQDLILEIFNKMYMSGSFPETWRRTLVKFIPKNSGGYRPISYTSCLSKLFERFIQGRLEYLSETLGWLPGFQYGF